jgi:hypothetical protein
LCIINIDAVHVAVPASPRAKAMLLPVGGQLASVVLAPAPAWICAASIMQMQNED